MPCFKKKGRDVGPALLRETILQARPRLSSGARQGMDPAVHPRFGVLNILVAEPLLKIDSFDWINRTHKVALITERNRGVDTMPPSNIVFEAVHSRSPA